MAIDDYIASIEIPPTKLTSDYNPFWFNKEEGILQKEEKYTIKSNNQDEIWRVVLRYDLVMKEILSITFTDRIS